MVEDRPQARPSTKRITRPSTSALRNNFLAPVDVSAATCCAPSHTYSSCSTPDAPYLATSRPSPSYWA